MRSRPPRWSAAVVVLHWLNAALILVLLAGGLAMTRRVFGAATTFELYQQHKSLGFAALALTLLRLAARAAFVAPRPVAGLDGRAARVVQAAFYVFTLAAVTAGWLAVSASPLPVPTRVFGLFVAPALVEANPALFAQASLVHQVVAYAIAALIVLHAAGAAKHRFIDRDDTLSRMTPQFWRPKA